MNLFIYCGYDKVKILSETNIFLKLLPPEEANIMTLKFCYLKRPVDPWIGFGNSLCPLQLLNEAMSIRNTQRQNRVEMI